MAFGEMKKIARNTIVNDILKRAEMFLKFFIKLTLLMSGKISIPTI